MELFLLIVFVLGFIALLWAYSEKCEQLHCFRRAIDRDKECHNKIIDSLSAENRRLKEMLNGKPHESAEDVASPSNASITQSVDETFREIKAEAAAKPKRSHHAKSEKKKRTH